LGNLKGKTGQTKNTYQSQNTQIANASAVSFKNMHIPVNTFEQLLEQAALSEINNWCKSKKCMAVVIGILGVHTFKLLGMVAQIHSKMD